MQEEMMTSQKSEALPAHIQEMIPKAAEQMHQAWLEQSLSDGWQCGEQLDEAAKISPFLVPYQELPEKQQKNYCKLAEYQLRYLLDSGYILSYPKRKKDNSQKREAMEVYFRKIQALVKEDNAQREVHEVYFRPDNRLTLLKKSADLFHFDEKLKKAIITFINAETYSNARQVYEVFFGIFPDSDILVGYLHSLHDFEEKAATLNNKQRDHFVHSVNVFILGLVVYSCNTKMRTLIDKQITDQDKPASFLRMWGIAALMHDIGYPAEIAHNNIIGYFERLNSDTDRGNNNVQPYIEIGYFDRFNSIKVNYHENPFGSGTNFYLKPLDLISNRLAEVYGCDLQKSDDENPDMDITTMKNHINSYFPYMHSAGFTDHGFFSAIMVLRQFASMLRSDTEDAKMSSSSYQAHIVEAATAIFLHNSWRYLQYLQRNKTFYKKHSSKNTGIADKLSPKQFPLGYLMILCDELQDWNRTAYGKEDKIREKGGFLAESADIKLVDDDNLIITYYTKSHAEEEDALKFRKKKFDDIDKIIDFTAVFKNASIDNFADTADIIEIYRKPMIAKLNQLRKANPDFMSDEIYASVVENLHEKLDKSAKFIFTRYNDLTMRLYNSIDHKEWEAVPLTLQLSNIRQASQIFERIAQAKKVIRSSLKENETPCKEISPSEMEKLAAAEHDSWSCERVASGWTPAAKKDVENKKTPFFLEYQDLDNDTQEFDREAVRNCLLILDEVFGLCAVDSKKS